MTGLIGFFDILGYQSFLNNNLNKENNSTSEIEATLKVLDIINKIPIEVKETLHKVASESAKNKKFAVIFSNLLESIVFSDTIVFTVEYGKDTDEETKSTARKGMVLAGALLTKQMFYYGLPIRGVLHEGEFLVKKNCLAGKAVVDSYRLCQKLDFSGLVCTDNLKKNLHYTNVTELLFEYLTPIKNEKEQKLLNINWLFSIFKTDEFINEFRNDIDSRVLKSFWDHEKDCPISVDGKILNTTKSIRKMIQISNMLSQEKADPQ